MKIRFYVFLIAIFFSKVAFANSHLTLRQKVADFDQLVEMIRASYAPLDYKRSRGISLDALARQYRAKRG